MKISSYKTDEKLENEGKEFDMGGGGFATIARAGNKAYTRLFRRLTKTYKEQIKNDTLPPDIAETIYIEVLARTILLGWRGNMQDFDGTLPPYSVEKAIEWLRIKDFRVTVVNHAETMRNFQDIEDEDDEELLGKGLSGTSSGVQS